MDGTENIGCLALRCETKCPNCPHSHSGAHIAHEMKEIHRQQKPERLRGGLEGQQAESMHAEGGGGGRKFLPGV